ENVGTEINDPKILPVSRVGFDGILYVQPVGATPVLTTLNSLRKATGECVVDVKQDETVPIEPVIDLSTLYTPPFKAVGQVPVLP
ncbi:MAG: hypothetical protein O7G28_13255, partial [Deltaproteobacteria bacterium]|nr:hypothetical protein [Deltaproteobacteria bacterium]